MFKQNQEIFNILFNAVSEGILIVNNEQTIVAANKSVNSIFGYDEGELVNKHLSVLIPSKFHANHKEHFKGFIHKNDSRKMGHGHDLYGLTKQKNEFPVEVGLNPFEIFGQRYVLAIIVDITNRKEAEQKIEKLNQELEHKIVERTAELNNTITLLKDLNLNYQEEIKKRVEAESKIKEALRKEIELNELKTKFLSLVSHEFKTPLSGILTSSMLLGKYTLTEQQEKRDKHLKTITSKVHYLNNILDDFLSLERMETGKVNYKFTTFNLSKIVNEVVYNANMLLKSGQRINIPQNVDEYIMNQDEKILELALTNLLHNAIKYSPENTDIDMSIEQVEDILKISVTDKGMGIPEKDQKHIFNRYFRAENVLNNQGTGIGLNIVKGHLENIGGNINFVSKENVGSTFTVEIPLTYES
jgi:hypothetical protein